MWVLHAPEEMPEEDYDNILKNQQEREANKKVVSLWRSLEDCAKRCIGTRREQVYRINDVSSIIFRYESGAMTIEIPSGRKLFYPSARMGKRTIEGVNGSFEVEDISYMGQNKPFASQFQFIRWV